MSGAHLQPGDNQHRRLSIWLNVPITLTVLTLRGRKQAPIGAK